MSNTISGNNTTQARITEQPTTTTRSVRVDGESNHIRPSTLEAALDGDASATRELRQNAGFAVTLRSGTDYELSAHGRIEDGAWDNDEVDAGDKVDYTNYEYRSTGRRSRSTRTRESRTSLQFSVESPDGEVQALDYQRGMTLRAQEDGSIRYGDQTFPAGSTLRGHFLEDGRSGNNDGQYRVSVRETDVPQKTTRAEALEAAAATNAAAAADGRDIDRVDTSSVTSEVTSSVAAASVPEPALDRSRQPADRALTVDRENGEIRTSGDYKFRVDEDGVTVIEPGAEQGTFFDLENQRWVESDGTYGELTPEIIEGRFVNGDTSAFRFNRDSSGRVTGITINHDDALVDVTHLNHGHRPSISNPRSGGLNWRAENFEDPSKLTLYNGGYGREAAGTQAHDKQTGWYATQGGRNLGWVQGDWAGDNVADGRLGYVVDEQQRPRIGTRAYENAIQNAIAQDLGETAGTFQHIYGADRREAYDAAYAYTQGNRNQLAQYSQLNQLAMQYPGYGNLFGSLPQSGHQSLPQGLQAFVQLQMLMAQLQALQNPAAFQRNIYG